VRQRLVGSFTQWVSASRRAWLNPSIVALSSATSEKALSRSILKACSVSTPSVAKDANIQPGVSSGRTLDRRRRRRMQPCAHISIVVLRFSPSAGSSPVYKGFGKLVDGPSRTGWAVPQFGEQRLDATSERRDPQGRPATRQRPSFATPPWL
jgi:hypothetical protein